MGKRALLLLLLALACAFAAPAFAGDSPGEQKAAIDAKLANVHTAIAREQAKASHLSGQVASLTTQIHSLERRVGGVSIRLESLQSDLALRHRRLARLDALYRLQTTRFHLLQREYALAVRRLDLRLIAIYKQNEPTTADVVLSARSFSDAIDELDYLGAIAKQDKSVAQQVKDARIEIAKQRKATATVRQGVQREANVINVRLQQVSALRGQLLGAQGALAGARLTKKQALAVTQDEVRQSREEANALAAASARIAERLREDQPTGSSDQPPPSSGSGLAWPLSGPITSPFGPRWGSFHPGIDIGVPTGTPIHAAAAGTVVWCGWMSGYGNLVMIDHHNGLATLYGHQSRIAASCGEEVTTGELIGYVGCTGFCTGPHLHFEVRLNGTPVDPLGYLP
jgi:murein DD-endopeptidase MepM/ murein hydrolase activator NlpD